ncbi:hypothetical protein [Aquibacillus salsiterrae]|uniref:Uncharacterized protein n=1 Tax=Aquibacillus salsiterrae TaxID=2950439 RepID=A0A9X4AGK8_9BACI|nr:hypothetical protein [Aquibacillus salsiterrae]MDC3417385.1 hypothetical protein [Aquibacillus salsiterrae]
MTKDNQDHPKNVADIESLKNHADDKLIYINIEHLEIQTANVEELIYKLEKLDIKELSGALNIGNNLGTTVNKQPKQKTTDNNDERKKKNVHTKERHPTTRTKKENHKGKGNNIHPANERDWNYKMETNDKGIKISFL